MHGYANDHGVIVHVSILQQTHKTHETFIEFHGTMQSIAFKRSSILIFHLHDWRVNISSIPNHPKNKKCSGCQYPSNRFCTHGTWYLWSWWISKGRQGTACLVESAIFVTLVERLDFGSLVVAMWRLR